MTRVIGTFFSDEQGAVTVDWTSLSAAAVGLSLATAGMLNDTFQSVISRVDGELREQQMNDNFIDFTSAHFEPLYAGNHIDASEAETLFTAADSMLNQELIDSLETGIEMLENGTLTTEDAAALMAIASVAWQRNVVSDQILDYYFGFDGNESPRINDLL
jgi:hypothetical protein